MAEEHGAVGQLDSPGTDTEAVATTDFWFQIELPLFPFAKAIFLRRVRESSVRECRIDTGRHTALIK